jgi:uncharacterized alkaline shock family protein YloU
MSESEEQRTDSPLLSERGVTKISDTVVSSIAGMAAQEVEGVHMGGGTSRAASGVLGSITGSESKTSGISVEVGTTETAIDLKMGVEYNKNILQTVEEVRRRITDRVEEMTGLRIKELNATITDITFPEKEQGRRLGPARSTRESDSEQATDTAPETQPDTEPETQQAETQQAEAQQAEATPVEPTSPTDTEGSSGPAAEEEVRVEDPPLEEGETAEVRTEEQRTDEVSETYEETQETNAETETTQEARAEAETPEEAETRPEPETAETESPEARMRRRAEERARRRRRRNTEDS